MVNSTAEVQYLTFPHLQPQRLDNFLISFYTNVPKSRIYRIIRKGEVRVNGGRKRVHYKLRQGDQVRVPPITTQVQRTVPHIPQAFVRQIKNSVIAETSSLLVLNKPAGVAVHGGTGVSYGSVEALNVDKSPVEYVYLGHRLDRDTSGVLLLARTREMMHSLHAAFRQHKVKKEYVGLVAGRWPSKLNTITMPLERINLANGERRVRVSQDGLSSKTDCSIVERSSNSTLMRFFPVTGRTHQIRVHASHAKHPIYGDQKYAQKPHDRKTHRLMLHALRVTLPDGVSFEALPSQEFNLVCDELMLGG